MIGREFLLWSLEDKGDRRVDITRCDPRDGAWSQFVRASWACTLGMSGLGRSIGYLSDGWQRCLGRAPLSGRSSGNGNPGETTRTWVAYKKASKKVDAVCPGRDKFGTLTDLRIAQ